MRQLPRAHQPAPSSEAGGRPAAGRVPYCWPQRTGLRRLRGSDGQHHCLQSDHDFHSSEYADRDGQSSGIRKEASTTAFDVNPGTDLFRFRWTDEPGASQTAGQVFDRVEVSAYDEWDNIKTDYDPTNVVFSGLNQSPSGCNADNATLNPSGTFGCDPIYSLSFVNGIADSTTVKDYKAETTQLTVTDGSVTASTDSGTPDTFTVAPAALNRFTGRISRTRARRRASHSTRLPSRRMTHSAT